MALDTVALELWLSTTSVSFRTTVGMAATIMETIYGQSVYKIIIENVNIEIWNDIAREFETLDITFRWGRSGEGGNITWCEKRNLQPRKLSFQVKANMLTILLLATDKSFLLHHHSPQRVFDKMAIPEILVDMASKATLRSEIDSSVSSVKYTLYQGGMSDYVFMNEVLLPRVGSKSVLLFMDRGDRLVLKQRKKEKPVVKYSYSAKGDDESIVLSWFKSVVIVNGSNFGTLGVAFDPLKQQGEPYLRSFLANDESEIQETEFAAKNTPSSIAVSGSPGSIDNMVIEMLGANIDEELKSRVDWTPPLSMYRVVLPSYFLPQVEVANTVYLEAGLPGGGKQAFTTGNYLIYGVYHQIQPFGDVMTYVFGERRGSA